MTGLLPAGGPAYTDVRRAPERLLRLLTRRARKTIAPKGSTPRAGRDCAVYSLFCRPSARGRAMVTPCEIINSMAPSEASSKPSACSAAKAGCCKFDNARRSADGERPLAGAKPSRFWHLGWSGAWHGRCAGTGDAACRNRAQGAAEETKRHGKATGSPERCSAAHHRPEPGPHERAGAAGGGQPRALCRSIVRAGTLGPLRIVAALKRGPSLPPSTSAPQPLVPWGPSTGIYSMPHQHCAMLRRAARARGWPRKAT